jgi:membrane protease YdiL (CAAX protease family)
MSVNQPITQTQRTTLFSAWAVTLLISYLPDILWREVIQQGWAWLIWFKIGLLLICILLTFFWLGIRPLRQYFIVFLVLYLVEWLFARIASAPIWETYFPDGATFTNMLLGDQLLGLAVALVMVVVMLVIKRKRSEFFLVKGETNAPATPVRWLGISGPLNWTRLGWILSLAISLGTLTFLIIAGRPSLASLGNAVPLIPAILVFAAMNAFSEEMSYRAPQLATSHEVVGKNQAMLLSAAFFGIGHYYGVPYGVVGVLMAGFLGWLLSKSMLETKGFLWPWFIHFLQDVVIFTFLGIGSIMAGGG